MQSLRNFIEQYAPLPENDWQQIAAGFGRMDLATGEWLLKEGQICRHLYFLEEGLMRFTFSRDGEDLTKFFTDSPYLFTAQTSFTKKIPAMEGIQAIEDCILWKMERTTAYQLLELKSWNAFVRTLIQEVQYFTEAVLTELQSETAENRYKRMLIESPELLQRIPLKYLASYFGIAPQSLSRIRKKITC